MKRKVLFLFSLLLLGLCTSIGVAWLGVLLSGEKLISTSKAIRFDGWVVEIEQSLLKTKLLALDPAGNDQRRIISEVDMFGGEKPQWIELDFIKMAPPPRWSRTRLTVASYGNEIIESASGFPFRCLMYSRILDQPGPVRELDFRHVGVITGGIPNQSSTGSSYLPVRPLIVGLVIDSIFYILIWLGLAALWMLNSRQRASQQRRKGRCAACGYDLRAASGNRCSECGEDQNFRPALVSRGRFTALSSLTVVLAASLIAFAVAFHQEPAISPIHAAAYRGEIDELEQLLMRFDVDDSSFTIRSVFKPTSGVTPLMLATAAADVKTVEFLLQNGADPLVGDSIGRTPLHFACSRGNLAMVLIFLKAGVPPGITNNPALTPLYYSSFSGFPEIVDCLVDAGYDIVNERYAANQALHIAARQGHMEWIQRALDRGILPNVEALRGAIVHGDLELCLLFEKYGADPLATTESGRTLFHAADRVPAPKEIWKHLLETGIDINASGANGYTPLMQASNSWNDEYVNFLLEHGAKLNLRSVDGFSALDCAATVGCVDLVRLLMQYDAEVVLEDKNGKPRFHYLTDEIRQLLEAAYEKQQQSTSQQ